MSKEQNNANIVSICGQRLNALTEHVKTTTAITVNGKSVKPADLIAVYQASIDTRAALVPLRAALNRGLDARDGAEVARQETDKGLRAWVVTQFGADSQEAEEFGFLPPKIGERSAETKAAAVEKSLATRAARGTRGKRQREKIKGTIVAPATPTVAALPTPGAPAPASVVAPANGAPTASGVLGPH
jgi:hypothetical protein